MARQETYFEHTGNSSRDTKLKYDHKLNKWVASNNSRTEKYTNKKIGKEEKPKPPKNDGGKSGGENKSKDKAEKEYIERERNTLTGELVVTASPQSIKVKVSDTIFIHGLGKFLSGSYYVEEITRRVDKDNGYSHSFRLVKNGFGGSLKPVQPKKDTPRKAIVVKEVKKSVKIGERVRISGDAVYTNAHLGVKVPKWVKQKDLTIDGISKDGTRVRVQPINSWVYVKNVQPKK